MVHQHQVMGHNGHNGHSGHMQNMQVPKAAPFPPLPVSLSRQHLPDRDPGSFTPPAAGVGPYVARAMPGDGTPTSRAKSPSQPSQGLLVRATKSPPRMPGPKSCMPNSARNTPKPQARSVSFAPSPNQKPYREDDARSPSPDQRSSDRYSLGRRIQADFRSGDVFEEGSRASRHSQADSIPESPPKHETNHVRERELVAWQDCSFQTAFWCLLVAVSASHSEVTRVPTHVQERYLVVCSPHSLITDNVH